jgi:hypothetical protein
VTTSDEPTAAPGPVRAAFWILVASAALSVLAAVTTLASFDTILAGAVRQGASRDTLHAYLVVNIALDLAFAAVYVLLGLRVRAGANWARITVTVIVVVFALFDILTGTNLITVVAILAELVAVGLLYLRTSSPYFTPDRR